MSTLLIKGGRVVDPAHGVDEVRDVWIRDGVVAAPDSEIRPDRTIDARGDVVMAAGVDIHCHVVGSKVTSARMLRPEELRRGESFGRSAAPRSRSGACGGIPTTHATGAQYAGLGYTTALDAAIAPSGARQAHLEFADTPILDKAMLILLADHHYVLESVRDGDEDRLDAFIAWILDSTKGFGIKAVNPAGIETWKRGGRALAHLDDRLDGDGVSPREILTALARSADRLRLPHPVHLHGLQLGIPGNASTTLETMRAAEGHRLHLAHIQFHSYEGDPSDTTTMRSGVAALVEEFNRRPELSLDVGQVMFGEATAMTADSAVGRFLHEVTGRKWISHDIELETGCGVVPITYHDRNFVHGLQWAIGLEWYLAAEDLDRVALSTDHPNGASFTAYPEVIALLMDRGLRDEMLARVHPLVRERSALADLSREYDLSDVARITRSTPARLMGLDRKGHLGVGADGDVTIYRPDIDKRRMFALPRYLIKAGEVVLDDGELRDWGLGRTYHASTARDLDREGSIEEWFNQRSTIRFRNFGAGEVEGAEAVNR
ncbi:MAG: formylmethanofuran dehydrogenase subunit A [Isosphaeraceae bacterium]|nr:formylmethanofuran dehydrogenase subunit A [Isosphaeraceae bacterium]